MHLTERLKKSLFAKSFHSAADDCPTEQALQEKLATQIQWMRMRGIDIDLKEDERPRPAQRQRVPLPGTVIHFSGNSTQAN